MRNGRLWFRTVAVALGAVMVLSTPISYVKAQAVSENNVMKETEIVAQSVDSFGAAEADLMISSMRELNEFAQKVNNGNRYEGKLVKVTKDIAFDSVTVNNFTPINGFSGTFDGGGYVISGIDVTDVYDAGLFGKIHSKGIVKNVIVKDSDFMGTSYSGGIGAYNYGRIENCHNINTKVSGKLAMGIGGIAGYNSGTVINCSSSGDVLVGKYAGGIVGDNSLGCIYNSCNTGIISATANGISGGVAGISNRTIQNCYNTGNIASGGSMGGIVGRVSSSGIVANSYCSEESAPANFNSMYGTEKNNKALPANEMRTSTFVNLLNTNRGSNTDWLKWELRSDSVYPLLVKIVDISKCTISLGATRYEYNGKARQPSVTVKSGNITLKNGTDYTLTYQNNVYVGTAKVTVAGKGSYSGSMVKTYTIARAAQKITYTKTYNKVYGNKAFTVKAKLLTGDGKLSYSSSKKSVATVNNSGRVTIRGTGVTTIAVKAANPSNYNGNSVKIIVKVSPKKQVISNVGVADNRRMTVNWKRDAGATGYQLQYSTNSKFKKGVKTITITKNSDTSRTIKNLKRESLYFVRLRAYKMAKVNGKNTRLYGSWSTVRRSGKIK